MLFYKNKLVCERGSISSFKDLSDLKSYVQTIPGLQGKVFDAAETIEIPDECFAYFKNEKTKAPVLQFIKSKITPAELSKLANDNGFTLVGNFEDQANTKLFMIQYKDNVINCRWSGGPGKTNMLTELSEYATLIAISGMAVDDSDPDLIADIIDMLYEKINDEFKSLASKSNIDKLVKEYAISAVKSAKVFYSKFGIDPDNYEFDRQLEDQSCIDIYTKASDLGASNPNNWNPADIWGFRNDLSYEKVKSDIKDFTTLAELNNYINEMMGGSDNEDLSKMKIIPISLKKIDPKKDAKIERMNPSDISAYINDGISIADISFNGTFKRFDINLSNGYKIQVYNSQTGFGPTRWELQKPGSGAKCGNIDKAELINKYIFEGVKETEVQDYIFGKNIDEALDQLHKKEFYKYVNNIYRFKNSALISQSKSELIKAYEDICDRALESNNSTELKTIITMVVALYYCVKNISKVIEGAPLIETMYLNGLKVGNLQCPYIKIYQ